MATPWSGTWRARGGPAHTREMAARGPREGARPAPKKASTGRASRSCGASRSGWHSHRGALRDPRCSNPLAVGRSSHLCSSHGSADHRRSSQKSSRHSYTSSGIFPGCCNYCRHALRGRDGRGSRLYSCCMDACFQNCTDEKSKLVKRWKGIRRLGLPTSQTKRSRIQHTNRQSSSFMH